MLCEEYGYERQNHRPNTSEIIIILLAKDEAVDKRCTRIFVQNQWYLVYTQPKRVRPHKKSNVVPLTIA